MDEHAHLIRLTTHPTQAGVLLAFTAPDLAEHMGTVAAARYSPDDHAYLLAVDSLPALTAMARHYGITLVDQRPHDDPEHGGPHPVPQECRHCAQPGSWLHPPEHCPSCGKPWEPVAPPPDEPSERRDYRRCQRCGHGQAGRFPHCARCGATLPPLPKRTAPAVPSKPAERAHLADPLPLGAVMADALDPVFAAYDDEPEHEHEHEGVST